MKYVIRGCKSPEEMKKADKAFSVDEDLRKNVGGNIAWCYNYATKVLEVVVPEEKREGKEPLADPIAEKLSAYGKVEVSVDA